MCFDATASSLQNMQETLHDASTGSHFAGLGQKSADGIHNRLVNLFIHCLPNPNTSNIYTWVLDLLDSYRFHVSNTPPSSFLFGVPLMSLFSPLNLFAISPFPSFSTDISFKTKYDHIVRTTSLSGMWSPCLGFPGKVSRGWKARCMRRKVVEAS